MKMRIKLGNNSKIGSLESEPLFLLKGEENKLQIEFETDISNLLIVTLKNGERFKQIIVRDGTFFVPPELICEGQLEIIVSLYERKVVMKRWICEPISIYRTREESFEVYSAFQRMTERIDYFDNRLQALEQAINFKDREQSLNLKKQVDTLQKQIDELWQAVEQ